MARKSTSLSDRRTKFTKNLIRETYLKLAEKKSTEKITVTEICKIAEINRGTFYLHYNNPFSVMHEIEDDIYETIVNFINQSVADENNRQSLSDTLLQAFLSDKYFLFACSPRLMEKTRVYAENLMKRLCLETGKISSVEAELFSVFIINACFGVVRRWYDHGTSNLEEENIFVNKMIGAVFSVAIDPYSINQAFRSLFGQ